MSDEMRIVEINGIKIEADMRTAKKIDTYKVGDPVKVLDCNYQTPQIRPGVIVDFAEFGKMPAIEVMMLSDEYNGIEFKFITITGGKESKYEISRYSKYEKLFTRGNVLDKFERLIDKKKIEIDELERKREYFVKDFEKAFSEIASEKSGE
jgi:hypothetical protein